MQSVTITAAPQNDGDVVVTHQRRDENSAWANAPTPPMPVVLHPGDDASFNVGPGDRLTVDEVPA